MNKIKEQNILCDCGCDVRGLTQYQLSGYVKNYDKMTINGTTVIDKHLDNNEHVISIDLGYTHKHTAIKKAKNIIEKYNFNNVEWFEVWNVTDTELIKTIS